MLQVTQYIQPLPGWSMPHLVLCSDGNHYVIKLLSNPQGVKVLVNELICSQLAKKMDLPIPDGKVIFIPKGVNNSPSSQEGPHFGSRFIPHGILHPSDLDLARCTNIGQAADMILFDYWLDNNDRHIWTQDKQNLIIAGGPEPKLWMIDQANVFNGPHWNAKTLLNKMNNFTAYWGTLYQRFVPFIDGSHPFRESLSKLHSLTRDDLFNASSNIPVEWGVSERDVVSLVNYMEHRRNAMNSLIQSIIYNFPVWYKHYKYSGGTI
ncbi:hypothetical protein D3C77_481310 [compost metagenome]